MWKKIRSFFGCKTQLFGAWGKWEVGEGLLEQKLNIDSSLSVPMLVLGWCSELVVDCTRLY